jgi:hypothetical protein
MTGHLLLTIFILAYVVCLCGLAYAAWLRGPR